MNYYNKDIKEVIEVLSSKEKGLDHDEVLKRRKVYNLNEITDVNRITPLKRFLMQFNNAMVILLLIVGVLSFIYSYVTKNDYTDAIVILFSVVVNVIMGYFQEKKAEDSLEKLKSYVTSKVTVTREGRDLQIDSKELVPGDIITLWSGDKIPADCRVITSVNALIDESVLTGESQAVEKSSSVLEGDKALHERSNMIYSGTLLSNGKIVAIVTNTGNDTELGKIAKNLSLEKQAPTTLELKVRKVSKLITWLSAVLVALVIVYGVITKSDILTVVMLCISMIVASVPECLPIAITATLSVGAKEMAKKKAIVKKLSAIETLGCSEIICSDKTGTLTTNEMTVVRIMEGNKVKLNIREDIDKDSFLIRTMALCNDAEENPNKKNVFFGDSVEVAFVKYLKILGIDKDKICKRNKRLTEIPFDSNRKMMSTINKIDGKNYILVKGSLSSLIKRCSRIDDKGKVKKLSSFARESIKKQEKLMANDALKVLALAYKPITKDLDKIDVSDENDLIFLGLVGLIDPPRSDVAEAIEKCKSAGVLPIMITGDSLETALSVGKQIGIVESDNEGILGEKIRNLSDKELAKILKTVKVFARVTPEDKVRIVTFLQKTNKVIAMTGDGVNDAPAIKLANVGVGMGKSGSDVTKGAADIILMDDSFKTIVTAIEEGRRIYDNVINNILYNLSSNFTEIIIILVGMFSFRSIITPIHVLYIDLVADTLPSICLAFEIGSKDLMKRKPFSLNRNIFTPYFNSFLACSVIIEVAIALIVFSLFYNKIGLEMAQTMALLSIVLNEFVFAYNCRSLTEVITTRGIFTNKYLNIGMSTLILLQLIVFLTPIGSIFGLVKVSISGFILVFVFNILGFILIELSKLVLKTLFKN